MNKDFARDMDTTTFTDINSKKIDMLYTVKIKYNDGSVEYIQGLPSLFDIIDGLDNARRDNDFWQIADYKIINPTMITTIDIYEDYEMKIGD